MAAAALSEEEFQRMQMQLLELRTKNYTIGEKNLKFQEELLQNNKQIEDLRKELTKCQKTISRSKNAKEIEQLLQENDILQQKILMQEDEFRLQNETLVHEIHSLTSEKEDLKKEFEWLKVHQLSASEFHNNDDKIKLEAENSALRKLISNENQNVHASTGDLQLQLDIVLEEKRLLHENIKKIEEDYRNNMLKLQDENEKLSERLKKKQDSFLKLQEEKEQLYKESKESLEQLQSENIAEINSLKKQIEHTQLILKKSLTFDEPMNLMEEEGVEIDGEKAIFDCSLNETKLSLKNIQEKMLSFNNQLSESEAKARSLENVNEELRQKVQNLERESEKLNKSLVDHTELADKRKKLMVEMKEHLQEITGKHSEEVENLTRKVAEEQEAYKKLYDKEKETELKLFESLSEVQRLKDEISTIQSIQCETDEKIKELEENIQNRIVEYEAVLIDKETEHAEIITRLNQKLDNDVKDLTIQLEITKAESSEFEEKVKNLQQEAKDSIDDRKIHEKKNISMVKDLKRQLQVERSRAEKLQERLQEALNEQNRSVDDILQQSSFDKPKGDASSISSWSYVSGGTVERENKDDSSSGSHDSPNATSPELLETETTNLLGKITQLQQKNWTLEEKVNHLEVSNSALVDDVLQKTALIQFYCMEGRSDPHPSGQDKLTIKKIVDFIKDRGDENLKETNRRMQRMLEETLTKNMELLKHVETLSHEVARLSKFTNSNADDVAQDTVVVNGV